METKKKPILSVEVTGTAVDNAQKWLDNNNNQTRLVYAGLFILGYMLGKGSKSKKGVK